MALVESELLEAAPVAIFVTPRSDGIAGTGTAQDPLNSSTRRGPGIPIALRLTADASLREAEATILLPRNDLTEGDMVEITGVTGIQGAQWNGSFGIYNVSTSKFNYMMSAPTVAPQGSPTASRLSFPFDEIMRERVPENALVRIGTGTTQTRGFVSGGTVGFGLRSGWKLKGAGPDVTVLQLVGANQADEHYHILGMPIEPTDTVAISPLQCFEVSDMTLDANADNQPARPSTGYAAVACGAVRVLGTSCRITRVKTINWGTKSLKQGCFVISIIQATAQPTGADGSPIVTETVHSGIESCTAVQPSRGSIREVSVLHLGGLANSDNRAQAFARASFIRKNFIDCGFHTTPTADVPALPNSSAFITSSQGTRIIGTTVGEFFGKRAVPFNDQDLGRYIRFYNLNSPGSRWNGYFPILRIAPTFQVDLTNSTGSNTDSSFVVLGTEFRGISVSSGISAVVEQNEILNCWIGTYQSLLDDDAVALGPTTPPTLAREEHLDPLNALNIRSLIVRDNRYSAVAVGPYFNAGGVSDPVDNNGINYSTSTGLVTVTTSANHNLWVNARVKIEFSSAQPHFDGLREIISVPSYTSFTYQANPGLTTTPPSTGSYRIVSGTDFLVLEYNTIELLDFDETEFAIKQYPLANDSDAQLYAACGIIIGDNGLSPAGGPYVHRQVLVRKNQIRYMSAFVRPGAATLGDPAGMAMQLAGIKQVHVRHNVLELNARNPLRTFRCAMARFFNNRNANNGRSIIAPGWKDGGGHYDEPETLAEDSFILQRLQRRKHK